MSQLRTEPFTMLPLTELDEAVSISLMEQRIAAHLKNLRVDAPVLGYLWTSRISWEIKVAQNRIWLIVSLQESDQTTLELAAQVTRIRTEDSFLDDVSDVRQQLGRVKWRTLTAMSAAASPLDRTFDSPETASTSSIRQRVKRGVKSGKLTLAGWPEPHQIELEESPAVLPQGPEVDLSAYVVWLNHEHAGLRGVAIDRQSKGEPAVSVDGLKETRLGRAGRFARAEHGTRLQVAMDKGSRVRLRVLCQLDWATAAVVGFELLDFVAPQSKAPNE